MMGLNDDEKTIESMVEEYKMSMGGSFFNKFTKEPEKDLELENLMLVEQSCRKCKHFPCPKHEVFEGSTNRQTEFAMIKKGIDNHLFDTHELMSIYDNLSDYNKREFFHKIVVAFIKFKFNEDTLE